MKIHVLYLNRGHTVMATTITDAAFLRLLQLSSASLPVGGFSFSSGMEYAVDHQWLNNSDDIAEWLTMQLTHSLAQLDLPIMKRLFVLCEQGDKDGIRYWNNFLIAARETKELRLTDIAMGQALQRLLPSLSVPTDFVSHEEVSFSVGFTQAAYHWQSNYTSTALAYTWSWLEAQVAAATKLVPLGQTQAQQLLGQIQREIPNILSIADTLADDDLGASLPALAIASALHETQYSRLFRS